MTIQEIHDYILYILDKEQGGYVSSDEIDMALDRAQMTIFRHYLGNTRQYQVGREIPPVAYGMTAVVNEALMPFRTTTSTAASSQTINYTFGTEPISFIAVDYTTAAGGYVQAEVVAQEEFDYRRDSIVHAPSEEYPVVDFMAYNKSALGVTLRYLPGTLSGRTFTIHYLRRPVAPDLGTSVTLEWNEIQLNEIMNEAIQILSTNTQNQIAAGFGNNKVNTGS